MDTKAFIKNLRELFSSENKMEKKYSKVWINRVVCLGFFDTKKFDVNIQYDKPIPRKHEEIDKIIDLLHAKIEGGLRRIYGVSLHYFEEGYYHIQPDDILVYEEDE